MTELTAPVGTQTICVFHSESAWGTVSAPVDYFIPVASCGLVREDEIRAAKTFCGVRQSKRITKIHGVPQGAIVAGLHGFFPPTLTVSFAEYLLRWAFDSPETADRASKTIHVLEQDTGGTFKRVHSGMRVSQATLSGSSEGFLSLSLDLIGKAEAVSTYALTLPNDRGELLEASFADVVCDISGSTVAIESFTWQINYGLRPKFNGFTPDVLRGGVIQQTLTVQLLKSSTAWEVAHRLSTVTETTGSLTIRAEHSGTGASGNAASVAIAFGKLALVKAEDVITPEDLILNPLTFRVLKPNSSTASAVQTWSLVT